MSTSLLIDFNSLMVRLKDDDKSLFVKIFFDFNSLMVRLKDSVAK